MTRYCGTRSGGRAATWLGAMVASAALFHQTAAHAAPPNIFLDKIHRQATLISTVPDNGDQNPYAIVVAPVSASTRPIFSSPKSMK